jgi:glutamine synthetase
MPSAARLQAYQQIQQRQVVAVEASQPLATTWADDVFTLERMKGALPKAVFKSIQRSIRQGSKLDLSVADAVAQAMKEWATAHGALYYAHVFYPLTNLTAEKHDGFISPQSDGSAISEFSGKLLVQGEPDGSSFPNGGIRSTFEARGYTAWDVTSPAYLMRTPNGVTLCIPTVFVSWTGEALDKKTPLLRSNAAMDQQARRLLQLLGETEIAPVNSSCGAEQEYFLVDEAFAALRPDLRLAGRTLYGAPPAKGQQFDDHYFGAIPERVQVFMQDVEQQLYRLGIPAKTRHNEVAPGQFEIAPFHEAANVATDHQQLIMTVLRSTAKRHGFTCLLHEKPFAGVNGSGKHVNWSVGNSTQGNLLDPGDTPHQNLQFLLFCAAVIRGVHRFGPLMRTAIATASNDHRLGANEAPPAIISVYLGSQLEEVFSQIQSGSLSGSASKALMSLGIDTLPELNRDPGDRNRTSPFAFTGNRFEFRAVGSGQSVAGPLVVLNTILADSIAWVADQLEDLLKADSSLEEAGFQVIKRHRRCPAGAASPRDPRAVRASGCAEPGGARKPLRGLFRAIRAGDRSGGPAGVTSRSHPGAAGRDGLSTHAHGSDAGAKAPAPTGHAGDFRHDRRGNRNREQPFHRTRAGDQEPARKRSGRPDALLRRHPAAPDGGTARCGGWPGATRWRTPPWPRGCAGTSSSVRRNPLPWPRAMTISWPSLLRCVTGC